VLVPREPVIRLPKQKLPRNKEMGFWVFLSGFAREVMALWRKYGVLS